MVKGDGADFAGDEGFDECGWSFHDALLSGNPCIGPGRNPHDAISVRF
jgi:hypothetical protein